MSFTLNSIILPHIEALKAQCPFCYNVTLFSGDMEVESILEESCGAQKTYDFLSLSACAENSLVLTLCQPTHRGGSFVLGRVLKRLLIDTTNKAVFKATTGLILGPITHQDIILNEVRKRKELEKERARLQHEIKKAREALELTQLLKASPELASKVEHFRKTYPNELMEF